MLRHALEGNVRERLRPIRRRRDDCRQVRQRIQATCGGCDEFALPARASRIAGQTMKAWAGLRLLRRSRHATTRHRASRLRGHPVVRDKIFARQRDELSL